jgi:hypothetical protein
MAFDRKNLSVIVNNVKSGNVPSLWLFYNSASDTVTTSGYFTDKRLNVGDQIDVLAANYQSIVRYRVSAVSATGAATVLAGATGTFTPGGVQLLSGSGAANVTSEITLMTSSTSAMAVTLADGVSGQRKVLKVKLHGGGSGDITVTPSNLKDGTTAVFDATNETLELVFADGAWQVVSNVGGVVVS